VNNWDFAILKNTQINERFTLQFRAELFNLFNHAQFTTPSGLTNYSGGSTVGVFGFVNGTLPGRIGQLSLKLGF
jgi:hypothetical protein